MLNMLTIAVRRRSFSLVSSQGSAAASVAARRAFASMDHAAKRPESAYEPIITYKQSYLRDLLKADDANAPWHQTPVEMVSREVSQAMHSPHKAWN
ncbi:hypothetical protein GGI02_002933 [Coemansia sp. RSA 2322]|uniref:Uncharacterized protein n=1 Tax=Coemansia thaxteri TaxID=2663907 RepID=A0A9W8BP09_9FUNG|nr:hypothetical protein H4R26_000845 [Coemansia thaxteri]KAJ2470429.1 hypothetical protein GGI02_002933 [Coemansia sp. RSA 2322]KAJ2474967.1 hypothetical protein EV174_005446 [Coemansia sp. RSA 2320]